MCDPPCALHLKLWIKINDTIQPHNTPTINSIKIITHTIYNTPAPLYRKHGRVTSRNTLPFGKPLLTIFLPNYIFPTLYFSKYTILAIHTIWLRLRLHTCLAFRPFPTLSRPLWVTNFIYVTMQYPITKCENFFKQA